MAGEMYREIICPNCGAAFDPREPKCPFCGYIYAQGAERKFMRDLEATRQELDHVDDEARENYKAEWKKSGLSVTKKVLIVLLAVGILAGAFALAEYRSYQDKRDYAKEMVWQHEHFPELDELYEAGKTDELIEKIYEYGAEDHDVWSWEHYDEVMGYDEAS